MYRLRSKTIPVFVIYQGGCDLNFVEFRFKDQRSVWLNISYEMAKKILLKFSY